jgi:hypothetical protein
MIKRKVFAPNTSAFLHTTLEVEAHQAEGQFLIEE